MAWQQVATLAELDGQEITLVQVDHLEILLCRCNGELYALRNQCSHALKPLADGYIEDGAIFCPVHGASFSLQSGQALSRPASRAIDTYPLKVEGDSVLIDIAQAV